MNRTRTFWRVSVLDRNATNWDRIDFLTHEAASKHSDTIEKLGLAQQVMIEKIVEITTETIESRERVFINEPAARNERYEFRNSF